MLRNCILLSPIFIAALGQVMRWQQILQQMRSTAKVQGETSNTHLFTHTHTRTHIHIYTEALSIQTDIGGLYIHIITTSCIPLLGMYVSVCVCV